MEKYHTDSTIGKTNNFWNLLGSYECSGYGQHEVCYIDPEEIWSSEGVDKALMSHDYDAAIISVYHHLPSRHVASLVGHKTAFCWWDSVISMDGVKSWAPLVHQLCFDWGKGEELPNVFCVAVPQDTRIFNRDDSIEDIDVSFCGSMTSYWSDRISLVKKIQDAGINIWGNGGRGHGLLNLPIEEYASIFKRSKMCLNLSKGHGRTQRKGRTFEIAACGKFMLLNHPEMYAGWFEDGIDYVSFDDNDIVDKIRYYLANDDKRKEISNNLYNKYYNNYDPKHFWKQILNICGVSV
jgi:hypothetical protein